MSKKDFPKGGLPLEITHHVRDTCPCLHLQRAARATARYFDDALRPIGITSGQFSLLMSLNRPMPPTLGSVANLLAMDRTTLTANLKPLDRRGLIVISVDPDDKRSKRLGLTQAGRDLIADAFPVWEKARIAIEARIGPDKAAQLRDSLLALS